MSAISKIIEIHKTLDKAIDYIINPEKTENCLLVSSHNCSPYSAAFEMETIQNYGEDLLGSADKYTQGEKILAYHFIQSFSIEDSENLSYEEIHKMGEELAEKYTNGKHQYVVATHIDKKHIHNHIIFNSRSDVDFYKFRCEPRKGYYRLRYLNDEVLSNHGLSQEMPKLEENHKYPKFISYTDQLKDLLDNALLEAKSIEDFKRLLLDKSVEVNLNGKNATFKLPGMQRVRRGNKINPLLYADKQTIKNAIVNKDSKMQYIGFAAKIQHRSIGAKLANTQRLEQSLIFVRRNNITCLSDFNKKIGEIEMLISDTEAKISLAEDKLSDCNRMVSYIFVIEQNKEIYNEYKALEGRKQRKFLKNNYNSIRDFEDAADVLKKFGITPESVESDSVNRSINDIKREISYLKSKIKSCKAQIREIEKHYKTVSEVIDDTGSGKREVKSNNHIR